MILAVLALPLLTGGNVRVYQTSFGPIQELMAKSPAYARENARPAPRLAPFMGRVHACVSLAPTDRRLLSIRLAVSSKGRWLFVDERGIAKQGTEWGRFDVVAWEKLVRTLPARSGIKKSPIIDLTFQNQSNAPLRLLDAAGFERAAVPANGQTTVRTWFGSHRIIDGANVIGTIDRLFERATAKAGPPSVPQAVAIWTRVV
jgi:hypothetical protein